MFENITVETNDFVTFITINRPSQLNALNKQTIQDLNLALQNCEADSNTGVIILTGSGEKAFVAGADIKEFADFTIAEGGVLASHGQEILFDYVENFPKPIIAAINGFALGGGLELALSAHIRVASLNAKMGLPEVSLGVIPGYGGTQRLAQLVGRGRANEMIFTAGMISAEEALNYGLVNSIVEQKDLIETCEGIARKILKNSPMAIRSAIKAVNAGFKNGVNGFEVEIEEFGKCFGTTEFKEGTRAFLEKRKANFREA
ncbi:MAG: enoyl-CoA hydratase-related protein [Bacteroidota bacterium]|nr:enoyl-CoA hydratase-related protein [Bacteroidota bacterium]